MDEVKEFKIGDEVVLNSGGPTMKVVSEPSLSVIAEWEDNEVSYFQMFDTRTIKKVQ